MPRRLGENQYGELKPRTRRKKRRSRQQSKKALSRTAAKRHAIKTMAGFRNSDGTRKQSNIERKMETILHELGVFYVSEYKIMYRDCCRFYDFMVTNGIGYKFLIECDGAYHHCLAYRSGEISYRDMTKHQRKNVRNDEFKDRIAKELGIPLLRFWEDDIKRNTKAVAARIVEEITDQGGEVPNPDAFTNYIEPTSKRTRKKKEDTYESENGTATSDGDCDQEYP